MWLWLVWLGCPAPCEGDLACDPDLEPLAWEACDDGFDCATLHRDDTALAVVRHRSSDPDARVALMLQSGPGLSSIELLRAFYEVGWKTSDPELWEGTTWVAMDNRGVGASDPIDCVGEDWYDAMRRHEPVPADDPAATALRASRDALHAGCLADRSAAALAEMGTDTHIDDLEVLRRTMEIEWWDMLAAGAGTQVGAAYAARYPTRVGRFVLDGVVTPRHDRTELLGSQQAVAAVMMQRFFDRCEASSSCPFTHPQEAYEALLAAAKKAPLPAPSDPDGRTLSHNELRWAAFTLLHGPDDITLRAGIAEAAAGDAARLLAVVDAGWERRADGTYASTREATFAISCLEWPWPSPFAEQDVWDFGATLDARDPWIGSAVMSGDLACAGWPATADTVPYAAPEAPPMLLASTQYDPSTPLAGALAMLSTLDNDSELLILGGEGHVAYASDGTRCTYDQIRSFLLTGTTTDLDCP